MSTAWGLAIHAVGPQLGLALGADGEPPRWETWDLDRELASQLQVRLAAFLEPQRWSDLAFLAVAKGPGSFTSTRVGVVAARTLAQQLEVPLFGISTLAAAAQMAWDRGETAEILAVQMPARRQQLFGAVYARGGVRVTDTTFDAETWAAAREPFREYPELELPEMLGADVAGVLALARRAWDAGDRPHWSETVPFYGQHPVVTPASR